jgi:alpha/beta superfamily hydrolase
MKQVELTKHDIIVINTAFHFLNEHLSKLSNETKEMWIEDIELIKAKFLDEINNNN